MDDTNFASLSPTLLARKGGAKPAMRPQLAPLTAGSAAQSLEDLGWNDMGGDSDGGDAQKGAAEAVHLTPAPANPDMEAEAHALDQQAQAALVDGIQEKPEVHRQQEELTEKLGAGAEASNQDDFASLLATRDKPSAEDEPEASVETPVAAPVREVVTSEAAINRVRRSALERGKRAAFTLRLDAERHLKLRLACTLRSRSAQQLVTEALDELLGDMPDVDSLAAQVSAQT